ncbi:hypothetical protein FBEOM_10968 [Fusarium beomiforme]|uniref:Uncharacterized protein n=1 Tax=Fusarium beomiforme TaxID=44412 RepID=A0A9P5ABG4_9HYPO|nr:hypothetical protein FBEOM_10968 [Fusarium beomiforme]
MGWVSVSRDDCVRRRVKLLSVVTIGPADRYASPSAGSTLAEVLLWPRGGSERERERVGFVFKEDWVAHSYCSASGKLDGRATAQGESGLDSHGDI